VSLGQCLTAIEEVCSQGYEVVRAHQDVRIAGPRELTEPTVTSEAVARCRLQPAVFGDSPKPAPPPSAAAAPTAGQPAPASAPSACFPGATQACVGPGACKGGQQCLANGSAFGPCDCGGAPGPTPPGAPSVEIPAPR